MSNLRTATFALAAILLTGAGNAQEWTAMMLHPVNATISEAVDVADGQIVGNVLAGGRWSPCLWTLDGQATNLDVAGTTGGSMYGVSKGRQVGAIVLGGTTWHAAVWQGTPGSVVDIHHAGASNSEVRAIHGSTLLGWILSGGPQVGFLQLPNTEWDILGSGFGNDTDGETHVGAVRFKSGSQVAAIWTLQKPILLDPIEQAGDSVANGVYGEYQVGTWMEHLSSNHAVIWRGSPGTREFLANGESFAEGIFAGQQVGSRLANGGATRWVHEASVETNLQSVLPPIYTYSEALAIWDDSEAFTYISGRAWIGSSRHAVLWRSENIDVANVEAMNVLPGVVVSGGLSSLQSSENSRLIARPGVTLSTLQSPLSIVVEGTASATTPLRLSLSVEAHASSASIRQLIEFFDFQSNQFVQLENNGLALTDDVYRADQIEDVSRFVEPGTHRVRARISYRVSGPVLIYPWEVRIDRVWWHRLTS